MLGKCSSSEPSEGKIVKDADNLKSCFNRFAPRQQTAEPLFLCHSSFVVLLWTCFVTKPIFFPPQGPLNTVSGRIHTQIEEMSRNEPVFSSLFLPLRCIFHFVYFSWVQSVVRIVGHRTWEHCLYFVHFVFPVVVRRKLQTVGQKRNPEGENTYMLKWRIKQQLSRWGKSETDKGEGIFSLNLQSARQSRTCSCWELCFVFLPPTVSHSNTYKTCEDLRLALTP